MLADIWLTGRNSSRAGVFGTLSALMKSIGACPTAMPFSAKNRLSPQISVCRPSRNTHLRAGDIECVVREPSSNSPSRPSRSRTARVKRSCGDAVRIERCGRIVGVTLKVDRIEPPRPAQAHARGAVIGVEFREHVGPIGDRAGRKIAVAIIGVRIGQQALPGAPTGGANW